MYLARFSYSVLPVNRDRAIELIQTEPVEAACQDIQIRASRRHEPCSSIIRRTLLEREFRGRHRSIESSAHAAGAGARPRAQLDSTGHAFTGSLDHALAYARRLAGT